MQHDADDTPESWPPVYYTNTVQVVTTAFDLQLHCSVQTRPIAPTVGEADCVVVMTPEHAQALVRALQSVLVEYEANHGSLRALPLSGPQREWEEQ